MRSLIYVSRRHRAPGAGSVDVDDIVAVSRLRNADLAVTGALIATPGHFAQLLEGSQDSLDTLMVSIARDGRHTILQRMDLGDKPQREFPGWTLAYHGESSYVANMLEEAVAAKDFELREHADQIQALMKMLA